MKTIADIPDPVFNGGMLVATRQALLALSGSDTFEGLKRHMKGDWGDLDPEDKKLNDEALKTGGRLLSAYHSQDGTKFWIITEADRSVTTILLPEDY